MEETTARWVIEFTIATVATAPSLRFGKATQALVLLFGYAFGGILLGAVVGTALGAMEPSVLSMAFNGAFTGLGIGGALGLPLSVGVLRG